jgi:hypothetical protein
MDKYDVKKAHRELYSPPSKDFVEVDVPEFRYLAVDGRGDPNTSAAYANAVEALYSVAYAVKFASKKALGRDFVVGPLEGLWRADDPAAFAARRKDDWAWTMMIGQPDWITDDLVRSVVADIAKKADVAKKKDLPALKDVRLRPLAEGRCVQILHIGSYDDEAPTLDRLHNRYLPDNGLTFNGDHHEIYLSDARRTEPAKLKTILRQPVKVLQ